MNDSTPAGSRATHRVPISTLASGFELGLTILQVKGTRPGPCVGVSAMIHGDEIEGLLICRELWRSLDPAQLAGSVWLLPVANPLAMEAVSRNTPIDMLDMNRTFPGVVDGWLSEQQAHAISHGFIDHVTHLVDIHAGGTFPWVDYCYVINDEAFSRAFLSELLYQPVQTYRGTTAEYAASMGIPTVVVEIGGGYQEQALHVANGVKGVLNVLRQVGVLDGEVVHRDGQLLMREMKVMRPRQGGLCVPRQRLQPGQRVSGGTALADVESPFGFGTLETMVAPFDDNIVVLARNYMTRIHPGDYTFMMGNGESATYY